MYVTHSNLLKNIYIFIKNQESFKDIINILRDSLSAGFEIQLKVLQVLLSFFTVFTEVYGDDLYNVSFIL